MEIKVGDKVRTVYGRIETVLMVEEPCRVWTHEYTRGWYHPTKLTPLRRDELEAELKGICDASVGRSWTVAETARVSEIHDALEALGR
jgi:hypothetical protein